MGLAITKRQDEWFWIGPDIKVTIRQVASNHVMLVIDAPTHYRIGRDDRPDASARPTAPCLRAGEHPGRKRDNPDVP